MTSEKGKAIYFPPLNVTNTLVFHKQAQPRLGTCVCVWIKSNMRKHVEKDSTAKPLEMFALHRALSGILTQINTSCYLLSSFFFWSLKVHQTGLDINFMGSWSECYSELIDTSEFTNAAFFFFSKSRVGMKTTSQTNGNIDIINLYNSIWHLKCFLYMFSLI